MATPKITYEVIKSETFFVRHSLVLFFCTYSAFTESLSQDQFIYSLAVILGVDKVHTRSKQVSAAIDL